MNRLVLIDGNAILHRAYHALPPLTTPDGSVVNAVYGFVSILIKLFDELKPTHIAVAFDRPEPTFRKTLFKAYQATRPEMDDDLVSQIPKVQDVVRAFGIPIYDAAGFEADDVIGTLTRKVCISVIPATEPGSIGKKDWISGQARNDNAWEIIIVTGDRDLLQLADDRVKVFMPTKGLSEGKLYGEAEVVEKMGVKPAQIPDLKALMGDASDNYPGVSGIGPKTAVGLIARYGSVERMYETLGGDKGNKGERGDKGDEIKLSQIMREKLLRGKEDALLSKDLATIRTDVPVEVGELVPVATLDTPEVRNKLEEFHFPSLLKRLTQGETKIPRSKRSPSKEPQDKKEEQLTLV